MATISLCFLRSYGKDSWLSPFAFGKLSLIPKPNHDAKAFLLGTNYFRPIPRVIHSQSMPYKWFPLALSPSLGTTYCGSTRPSKGNRCLPKFPILEMGQYNSWLHSKTLHLIKCTNCKKYFLWLIEGYRFLITDDLWRWEPGAHWSKVSFMCTGKS